MQSFLPTCVLRHRRENLKKCSLRGLESREDFVFYPYPGAILPDLSRYVMLDFDGPLLSFDDADCGLFVVDATWRYAEKMTHFVDAKMSMPIQRRSLPREFRTAYPRRQDDCALPDQGLASVEAVYIAYYLLGRNPAGLLDNYYWKEEFLLLNDSVLLTSIYK